MSQQEFNTRADLVFNGFVIGAVSGFAAALLLTIVFDMRGMV